MKIQVTFLGSGTSQGVPVIACDCPVCKSTDAKDKRLRSSILIQTQGKTFVVDTGPDFRQQMLRAQVQDVDAVLYTHEHKDHIAGMDDIRAFNFKYQKDIDAFASERVQQALTREFPYVFGPSDYGGAPRVRLHPIADEPFEAHGVTFTPINVMHGNWPVKGFRCGDFTYVTDANFIADSEKEKMKGSEVLVLNALRKKKHPSHFTLDEALELVEELQPKRTYFTHISHLLGKHADVSLELPPNVFLAYDGLQVELP